MIPRYIYLASYFIGYQVLGIYAYIHMFSLFPALNEGDSCDMPSFIHAADGDLPLCFVRL